MRTRLQALPGYMAYHEAASAWLNQDIAYHGDVYERYMTQAAEIYPEIIELWRALCDDQQSPDDYSSIARQLFGVILLQLYMERRPTEIEEQQDFLDRQIADQPAIKTWLQTRAHMLPPEPAEIEYVYTHYPIVIGYTGKRIVHFSDDLLGSILCARVYTDPDIVKIHSIHGVPAWKK